MQIKEVDRDTLFKLGVAVGALLVGIAFVYSQIVQPTINKKRLDKCLEQAKHRGGITGIGKTDRDIQGLKDECFKRYPLR